MTTERLGDGWIRRWTARPHAKFQLLFLPHAGGTAGYVQDWDAPLAPAVEHLAVQYPGRADRRREAMPSTMPELVAPIAETVTAVADRPLFLFGHSLGAAVAYELALELRRRDSPVPAGMIVSGRAAPWRRCGGDVHLRDDDGLVRELHRLGGMPSESTIDPDVLRGALEPVRSDFRIAETYRPHPTPASLPCPLHVFTGDADPELTPAEARHWRLASSTPETTEVRVFHGGHFYLEQRRAAVVETVLELLGTDRGHD